MTPEPTPFPIPPPSAPRSGGAANHLAEALSAAKRVARQVDEPELSQSGSAVAPTMPTVSNGAPRAPSPEEMTESSGNEPAPVPDGGDAGPDVKQVVDSDVRHDADSDVRHDADSDVKQEAEPEAPEDVAVGREVPPVLATSRQWRGSRSTLLLLAFMVVVVVAMPTLGYVGYHLLTTSTRGKVLSGVSAPNAPGYQALVDSTPVAFVIHTDNGGTARSLTILSLSGPGNLGGAVVSIPVTTRLPIPAFGIKLYGQTASYLTTAKAGQAIGSQLTIGFHDVIKISDRQLVAALAPLGTLHVDNPVTVTASTGQTFPSGPLDLSPARVPDYLDASSSGSTELDRLAREQLVWQAWIAAAGKSRGKTAATSTTAGALLTHYLTGIAAGQASYAIAPVKPAPPIGDTTTYAEDTNLLRLSLTNAVPYPVGAIPGDRLTVRVLNGTGPRAIPQSIMQRLVFGGGQIDVLGNASTYGATVTTLTYWDTASAKKAKALAKSLGNVKVVYSPNADQTTDVTVVIGRDLIRHPPSILTASEVGS